MLYSQTALGGAFKVSPVLHSACTLQVRQRPPRVRVQNRAFCLANMQEVWKPVPGYEGLYEVSDQGRVRSLDRYVQCSGPVKGAYVSLKKGRLLRPGPSNYGHLSVVLGRRQTRMVHDLVLRAFVGAPPTKRECCHNNGDPADNRLENLRWGTRSENNIDAVRHQRRGKLSADDVRAIRHALAIGARGTGLQLAHEYDVCSTTISAIKVGRHYGHLD